MFLVLDRSRTDRPAWLEFNDAVIRNPNRLVIHRWRLEPQAEWLITGANHLLDAVAYALAPKAAAPGEPGTPGAPRIAFVDDQAPQVPWWRRLLRLGPRLAGQQRLEAWLRDLPPGESSEALVLANIAHALAAEPDVLVLDRALKHVRGVVRFRVATDLSAIVAERGLALVALAETEPEGWIAVSRRAVLERGEWRDVHRRAPLATGSG